MRYSAKATALGPQGRKVRCASCGHNWKVNENGEEQGDNKLVQATEAQIIQPTKTTSPVTPEPASEPKAERRRDPQIAKTIRARREAERIQKKRVRVASIWAAVAFGFVLILVTAWMLRVDVVRVWPNSASVFSIFGSPVNIYGLEVQEITASRKMRGGTSVLQINGQVVNISKRKQVVPLLATELFDAHGQIVFSWLVEPEQAELNAGLSLTFITEVRDPPPGALRVVIRFANEKVIVSSKAIPAENKQAAENLSH